MKYTSCTQAEIAEAQAADWALLVSPPGQDSRADLEVRSALGLEQGFALLCALGFKVLLSSHKCG